MFVVPESDRLRVERFKEMTRAKLHGVRCPDHRQPPRLHFHGTTLREITISISGCCDHLMKLANARIASAQPATLAPGSGERRRETFLRVSAD